MKESIEELLKKAKRLDEELGIPGRKYESDKNGALLLDPNDEFDRDWYENDEAYDINVFKLYKFCSYWKFTNIYHFCPCSFCNFLGLLQNSFFINFSCG